MRRRIAELEKSEAEHKKMEAQLQESQARYQALFDRTLYCVFVHDFEGRFLDANNASFKLLGYSRQEFPTSLTSLLDQDQLEIAVKRGKEIMQTSSKNEPLEYKLRTKSGNYVWVEVESSLIYRGGKPYAIQGIARDITTQKLSEEALWESEEKFRNLAEQSPNMIFINVKGRIVYANKKCLELMGYTREEFYAPAFDFFSLIAPESMDATKEAFGKHMQGKEVTPYEYTLVTKKGRKIEAIITTKLLPYGGESALLGIITDITHRRHAEEELHRSYQQLRETFIETVNALASTVEMKDPYTAGHQRWATRLACTIAKEMGLSEERIEGIRMAGLIHDIGKINIPAEILSKPGQLSELQYNMVKIHPQVGCDILREIKFPWPVAEIVLQHHERMNGSGYPERRSGEEIILEARILAVADTVEAMASHRPYRVAHGIESALEEISQNRGTLHDPAVVDACLTLFEKGFRFD